MTEIQIYLTKFEDKLPGFQYNSYLNQLPIIIQQKNKKYIRWQDQHAHLFGKLLLLEGFKKFGFSEGILEEIYYDKYSRPYINGNIDFNISHSGAYVVCAIGRNLRVGIDVEEIKEINFDDFKPVMTFEQWNDIYQSTFPIRTFFKYWTIKESVIKADSRGLSIPLLDIHVKGNMVIYDNQTWYLQELNIDENHCASIAINMENIILDLYCIDFYNLENKEKLSSNEEEKTKKQNYLLLK